MGIKIKDVKSIQEIKNAHSFIAEQMQNNIRIGDFEKFSMVEIYNEMIDALQGPKGLQIKAEIAGVLIGYGLVTIDSATRSAWLKVILVKRHFQKKGTARKLIKTLEKNVKSLGFNTLKTVEREGANGFFIRAGYIPYLYVQCKTTEEALMIEDFNKDRFKIIEKNKTANGYTFKFDVEEEAVYSDKQGFAKLGGEISAIFVYEKKLK